MSLTPTRGRQWREALYAEYARVQKADREVNQPPMRFDKEGRLIRPMRTFDPGKPAILHDSLNDQNVDYDPGKHEANYRAFAKEHETGVINWDGLLIDGWIPADSKSTP